MSEFYELLSEAKQKWVDDTLYRMSIDELIGQKFAPLLNISWDSSRSKDELLERALKHQVGAVHVCSHLSPAELRADVIELRNGLKVPPLVSSDIETFVRYPDAIDGGSAMSFGAIKDEKRAEKLAYECGRLAARQARAMEINWALAPVVDLPFNHDNPIVATRAFNERPERVSALSRALLKGFQDGGLAATLKHFPGDGTDNVDQHVTTAINPLTKSEWWSSYGKTFGDGIRANVHSIMIGHFGLSWMSSRNSKTDMLLPATIDPKIMDELLRKEMGFDGIIVSDAIGMGGVMSHCASLVDASVKHIIAGGDIVLFTEDIDLIVKAVKEAILNGTYTEETLWESVRRILTIKATLGLHDNSATKVSLEDAENDIPQLKALAVEIAETSITKVCDYKNILPLKLTEGAKITICLAPDEPLSSEGIVLPDEILKNEEEPFIAKVLRDKGFAVVCAGSQKSLKHEAKTSDAIILISNCRPMAGRNSIRLSREGVRCFDWEIINSDTPVIYLNMGNPFTLEEIKSIHNCVCVYNFGEVAHEAVVKAILGETPFNGILPVTLEIEKKQ